jgi:hypothetical protein
MWLYQKWTQSVSIQQLRVMDSPDQRNSFLYSLAMDDKMSCFENIFLIGSEQDVYAPAASALLHTNVPPNMKDSIISEMIQSIFVKLCHERLIFVSFIFFDDLSSITSLSLGEMFFESKLKPRLRTTGWKDELRISTFWNHPFLLKCLWIYMGTSSCKCPPPSLPFSLSYKTLFISWRSKNKRQISLFIRVSFWKVARPSGVIFSLSLLSFLSPFDNYVRSSSPTRSWGFSRDPPSQIFWGSWISSLMIRTNFVVKFFWIFLGCRCTGLPGELGGPEGTPTARKMHFWSSFRWDERICHCLVQSHTPCWPGLARS